MSERSNSAIYAPEVRRIAVNSHLDDGCGDALLVGVDKDTENAAGNRCGRKAHFRPKTDSAVRKDRMVGATGIEPVTPSMSTRCSPAELRAPHGVVVTGGVRISAPKRAGKDAGPAF